MDCKINSSDVESSGLTGVEKGWVVKSPGAAGEIGCADCHRRLG